MHLDISRYILCSQEGNGFFSFTKTSDQEPSQFAKVLELRYCLLNF